MFWLLFYVFYLPLFPSHASLFRCHESPGDESNPTDEDQRSHLGLLVRGFLFIPLLSLRLFLHFSRAEKGLRPNYPLAPPRNETGWEARGGEGGGRRPQIAR